MILDGCKWRGDGDGRMLRGYGSIDFYIINNNNICKQLNTLKRYMVNNLLV